MSVEDLPLSLQVLVQASVELNNMTEHVNNTLRSTEHTLVADCQAGIEHWVMGDEFDADKNIGIGLVKFSKAWRLCICFPDTSEEEGRAVRPWENCPRDAKFVAVRGLPILLGELIKKVGIELRTAHAAKPALAALNPRNRDAA